MQICWWIPAAFICCINEHIQEQLQLPPCSSSVRVSLANGHIVEYNVVGPLEVRFKNRRCFGKCNGAARR